MKQSLQIIAIAAAGLLAASCKPAEVTRFATTDMTWAEFYAGELGVSAAELEQNGYDAVTSATMSRSKRFSAFNVSEDGAHIYGPKDVAVAMTDAVFEKLTDEQKARFTLLKDTTVTAFKQLDKKGNFGPYTAAVSTPEEELTPSVSCGKSSNWGHYTISLRGLKLAGPVHGVILTDNEGNKYGLKALDNIWLNAAEVAFNVAEFEIRGNKPAFKNTASLEGKTITNITYIVSGQDKVSIDADIKVKKLCQAQVNIDEQAAGTDIKVAVAGLPEGYKVSGVRTGQGRMMTPLAEDQYSFDGTTLTLNGEIEPASYRVTFVSEESTDLVATFEVK